MDLMKKMSIAMKAKKMGTPAPMSKMPASKVSKAMEKPLGRGDLTGSLKGKKEFNPFGHA